MAKCSLVIELLSYLVIWIINKCQKVKGKAQIGNWKGKTKIKVKIGKAGFVNED